MTTTERLRSAVNIIRWDDSIASDCVVTIAFLEGKIRLELCDPRREVFFADSGHCDTVEEAIESLLRDFEANPDF